MIDINEMIYLITNKPYFVVTVLSSNNRRIKKFTQPAASTEKGEEFFLINKSLKAAWWKPDSPVIDGLKFVTFVKISNAIPLKIEKETKYISTEYLVKEVLVETISEDIEKQKEDTKDGLPERFVNIEYPPTVLYQIIDAYQIELINSRPQTMFDRLGKWYIYIIIGAIILFWWMSNNGGKIL